MTRCLELADHLLIAEAVLGVPAELIADSNRIGLADFALAAPRAGFGGVEAACAGLPRHGWGWGRFCRCRRAHRQPRSARLDRVD